MPSSSKLGYLSKYTSDGGDLKKEKKKKKKKKRAHDESTGVALYDSDVSREATFSRRARGGEDQDDDNDDDILDPDDRPVVVELSEADGGGASMTGPRGTWEQYGNTTTMARNEEDAFPTGQTKRYDSSDDEARGSLPRHRRRRYDSDDDENQERRVTNKQSLTEERPRSDSILPDSRRRQYDSDLSHDEEPQRRRRRYDSDDDEEAEAAKPIKEEEDKGTSRGRHDSDSDDSVHDDSRARMSSGHKAGLQGYRDFNKEEAKLQAQKQSEAQLMVDKYGIGETVYREGSGSTKVKKKYLELDAQQQAELNLGKVQRDQAVAREREFQALHESAFARHQDDEGLEAIRRNEIRKGDPMAAYAAKKQQSKRKEKKSRHGDVHVEPEKPVYKGPPPKPNRFGIRPGYRWDGVDRGNGFEDKLLALQYSANIKNEEAYRWRSADM